VVPKTGPKLLILLAIGIIGLLPIAPSMSALNIGGKLNGIIVFVDAKEITL
jgi:hypothetical protein